MFERFRRNAVLSLVTSLVALGHAAAQDCSGVVTADEAIKAENARYAAQTNNDYAAMERLFGSDLIYHHSSAAVDDKASYIELMRSGRVKYVRMAPNADTKTRTFGCIAVITGTAVYDVSIGGKESSLPLRYTTVWAKRPVGLQFVSWQSTGIPAK